MTSPKAIRGMSASVLEKILAGPPNQMVSDENPPPKKNRRKGRKPKPNGKV